MKTNYKWLYKLILIANKNPNKTCYLDFSSDCLDANRDFDWGYETFKTNWVRNFIKSSIEHEYTRKEIKAISKHICESMCFYDEHIARAKYIIKKYKEK